MTVCVAALYQWNYGTNDEPNIGVAAMILTDRMITAGDVQYEPQQQKVALITPRVAMCIAGDYSIHSQAIKRTMEHYRSDPNASAEQIAVFYGRAIQSIKLKEAEDWYLAPLGLNTDSFIAQQKDMTPQFVSLITDQMQRHVGSEVEAIIVGGNNNIVEMYGVDSRGTASSFNDVGFAAIGSGAWHAKSRLMEARYTRHSHFSLALSYAFAAKKVAELAPGVGSNTDITLVFRQGIEPLRDDVASKVNELYWDTFAKVTDLTVEAVEQLQKYISKPVIQDASETPKGLPGGDAQVNERPSPPAAETPRSDQDGEENVG